MRVLAVILAFIAAGLAALLVMNREEKVMRTVPVSANAAVDGFTLAKPIVIAVPEKNRKKLRTSIERIGWMDRVQIKAVDLAERIVYAGPYSTEVKAAKALEKLVQEGLQNGKLFALDGKGWGIEIARTPERLQAENWAREAASAWSLKNVIVMERNPRKGYVELVFPNISQDENKLLIKTFKGREGGKFSACQP